MKKIHSHSISKTFRSLNLTLGILSCFSAVLASAQTTPLSFTLSPPTQYGVTATFVDQTSIQALLPPEQAAVLEGMIAPFMQESLTLSQNGAVTLGSSVSWTISPNPRNLITGSRNVPIAVENGCFLILRGVYATLTGRSATQEYPNGLHLEAEFGLRRINGDANCAASLDSLAMFLPNSDQNFLGLSGISVERAEQLSQLTLSIPVGITINNPRTHY